MNQKNKITDFLKNGLDFFLLKFIQLIIMAFVLISLCFHLKI
jgi:hypothetical protein